MAKTKKTKPPTDKQRAFVEHYLISWNATDAAKKAGHPVKSARQIGSENLSKPVIRALVEARLKEKAMGADEVLARLSDHGRGNIADFLDESGRFSLAEARANGKLHLVKKLKETRRTEHPKLGESVTTVTIEVELHDPQAALVHIGRHWQMFTERTELTGKDGGPIEVADIEAIRAKRWTDAAPAMSDASESPSEEENA